MREQPIALRLVGTRPLLMHAGRLADPLDPASQRLAKLTSKRAKTLADHREIGRVEWYGGLWTHQGQPCLPPQALCASFREAAKSRRRAARAKAGLIIKEPAILEYDGPRDIDEMWKNGTFVHRTIVKVGKARTARTRPIISGWSATFTAWYLPSLLSSEDVFDIYSEAGFLVAIGDWRPDFGTYVVERIE
jgi:hypothetical protein